MSDPPVTAPPVTDGHVTTGPPVAMRRTHPATAWVHALQAAPAGFGLGLIITGNLAVGGSNRVLAIAGVILLLVLIVVAYQYAAWRRFGFGFDADGDLRVDSGVLQRNERRVQLSRLQAVDVVQPWVARLTGMAAVRVEVAGAGESHVTLAFLTMPDAERLRDEMLGRRTAAATGVDPAASVAPPPEEVLTRVETSDLMLSMLLRLSTVVLFSISGFFLVITFMTEGGGALGLAVLTGGVPVFGIVNEYLRFHGFTVARSPDGLRLRHGLLQTTSNTVPPGRVQAVGFEEPWLWRRLGWVRVRLNLGGSVGTEDSPSGTVLLPVTSWDTALRVVSQVLPGVDVMNVPLEPAPRRARWLAPLQAGRLAVGSDDRVIVTRRGRVMYHLAVVPHARTQSLRVVQGPAARSLGLATMHVDSTPGPVRIVAHRMDALRCRQLAEIQADRAADARRSGV